MRSRRSPNQFLSAWNCATLRIRLPPLNIACGITHPYDNSMTQFVAYSRLFNKTRKSKRLTPYVPDQGSNRTRTRLLSRCPFLHSAQRAPPSTYQPQSAVRQSLKRISEFQNLHNHHDWLPIDQGEGSATLNRQKATSPPPSTLHINSASSLVQ